MQRAAGTSSQAAGRRQTAGWLCLQPHKEPKQASQPSRQTSRPGQTKGGEPACLPGSERRGSRPLTALIDQAALSLLVSCIGRSLHLHSSYSQGGRKEKREDGREVDARVRKQALLLPSAGRLPACLSVVNRERDNQ